MILPRDQWVSYFSFQSSKNWTVLLTKAGRPEKVDDAEIKKWTVKKIENRGSAKVDDAEIKKWTNSCDFTT